ncbi:hypothetical protein CHS0354_001281 [Potamilus streckersoni]|uniref:Metaxin n=1 Tax=Potamilus streckersoni TaxID=2493646 RepID=A0AAE0S7P6_9BIVA|nr:hypothetical protein CHS0354_001281 [Potamilus streckersoni]
MADDAVVLEVWKGDWDLPSVDSDCLAAIAYCKFSGVPVKVKATNNPWKSPSGYLPIMKHGTTQETKVSNIFAHLRLQGWGADSNLTEKEGADVIAFCALLSEKLQPALLYSWWIDSKTYIDLTRPWYAKASPFPLNYYVPGKWQRHASCKVYHQKGGDGIEDWEVEAKVLKEAKECLNNLSYKLGDQDFFFGDLPSSLDAIVFGYLAPILKAPLSGSQLQSHLRACDNLCRLCNRILHRFFPPTPEEMEEKRKLKEKEAKAQADSLEFPHTRRNKILAGIFAFTALVVYAFMSGLVQIEIVDDNNQSPTRVHSDNDEDD